MSPVTPSKHTPEMVEAALDYVGLNTSEKQRNLLRDQAGAFSKGIDFTAASILREHIAALEAENRELKKDKTQ
jgi:hypothetical protein